MADVKGNIAALIEPYRDRRGKLKEQLGDSGLRMLAEYCDYSPTGMCDFLGFPKNSQPNMTRELRRLGIETQKRDPGDPRQGLSIDEWEEFYLGITSQVERAEPVEWKLPAKHDEDFGRLHFLGDLHFGNAHQDSVKLMDFVEWLAARKHDRWILLGDLFELRTKSSKGEPPVIPQSVAGDLAVKWLEPIMKQCLLVHTGNHDLRIARQTDMDWDPVRDFARHFGVPYKGMDGFHILTITKGEDAPQQYIGYCHHGFGGARTPGARRNQLVTLLTNTNADYLAMAHLHDKDAGGKVIFGPDDEGIVGEWAKPVVRTGSWLKHSRGSFARESGIPPGAKGAVTLHVYADKHSVHARN